MCVSSVCTSSAILFAYSFVQKPQKGIKFLQERGLVGKESKDVATFFFEDDRLDRVCDELKLNLSFIHFILWLCRQLSVTSWATKISTFKTVDIHLSFNNLLHSKGTLERYSTITLTCLTLLRCTLWPDYVCCSRSSGCQVKHKRLTE